MVISVPHEPLCGATLVIAGCGTTVFVAVAVAPGVLVGAGVFVGVAVKNDCWLLSAACVAEIAVDVSATAVAVWATFAGSVGSGCVWPAAVSVSDRNACASDVSGRSPGRSSASARDGAY